MIGEPPRYQRDVAGGVSDQHGSEPDGAARGLAFLHRQSDWARGIPYDVVVRTLAASLNFGLFSPDDEQVGLARVVTDFGQLGYLCDVYVLPEHRGRGLGRALVMAVLAHPALRPRRRIALDTASPGFYEPLGFRALDNPAHHLERRQSAETLWPAPPGAADDDARGTPKVDA